MRGGGILDIKFESPSIAKNKVGISSTRLINVYIPTGYEKSDLRYPTIYWIGGYTDKTLYNYPKMLDDAIQNGKIAPLIVVFINTPEGTWFLNSEIFGYWEDFLVKELVPYIDGNYRTIPEMKKRGIGGHSAGGWNAIMFPLLYPGIWSDYINERFIALVEAMLGGLNVVSVNSIGKITTTWGNIKSNN